MKKAALVELIHSGLVNGDMVDDNLGTFHEQEIAGLIDLALGHITTQSGKRHDLLPIGTMSKGYADQAVTQASDGCYEVSIPVSTVAGQRGVLAVRPKRKSRDYNYRKSSGVNQIRNVLIPNPDWPSYY